METRYTDSSGFIWKLYTAVTGAPVNLDRQRCAKGARKEKGFLGQVHGLACREPGQDDVIDKKKQDGTRNWRRPDPEDAIYFIAKCSIT